MRQWSPEVPLGHPPKDRRVNGDLATRELGPRSFSCNMARSDFSQRAPRWKPRDGLRKKGGSGRTSGSRRISARSQYSLNSHQLGLPQRIRSCFANSSASTPVPAKRGIDACGSVRPGWPKGTDAATQKTCPWLKRKPFAPAVGRSPAPAG